MNDKYTPPPQVVCFECGNLAAKLGRTIVQPDSFMRWDAGTCDQCNKERSVVPVDAFGSPRFKERKC